MSGLRATLCASRDHYRFAALRNPWQADGEGRALPRLAFDRDVAAHHAAEMPADGEAEARAAVFAGGRGISLRKFLEQPTHLLFGHADSSIRDGDDDQVAGIELFRLRGDRHVAVLSELVGIARQVEQRLPEPGLVGMHRAEVRWAISDYAIAILRRHRLNCLADVVDHRQ